MQRNLYNLSKESSEAKAITEKGAEQLYIETSVEPDVPKNKFYRWRLSAK
jgi:hypothetical protein